MSRFFITRPIFSSVISIVIVIAGLVAALGLPVAQYPNITPPTVVISATYPGASAETLSKTTIADWTVGAPVNLERALRVGDELGGHIVSGHVDGVGSVLSITPEGQSWRFSFEAPAELMRYIAPKGSICIDGVSLTVNEVEGTTFGVNIIPHTFSHTTFGAMTQGQRINLEIDALARYVERIRTAN